MMTKGLMMMTSITIDDCRVTHDTNNNESDVDIVVNVDMTGTITITTRATTKASITLIYMATIITMKRRAVTMLPTKNSDVDGNAKDPYVNDIDHHDDNCKNDVVTVFRRENMNSVCSPGPGCSKDRLN